MYTKTKSKFIFIEVIFTFCFIFFAQSQTIQISGKISDKDNLQPLPFATVFSLVHGKGTISDYSGNFCLSAKSEDTLVISHLGYSDLQIPVNSLNHVNQNIFYLTPKYFTISEITVKPVYPSELIEQCLGKIPENYPDFYMYLNSYFSEKITENDSAIQLVEATMEILKSPYNLNEKDKIKFTSGKIYENVTNSKLWDYIFFINGPYELLYSDIAKNPDEFLQVPDNQVHFLNKNHFKHYIYSYKDTSDKNIIIVSFKPNPESSRAVYTGEIVIDRNSLAFIEINFGYASERLNKVYYTESTMEIDFRQNGIYIPDNYYKCKVVYTKSENYWILKNVTNEYGFQFQTGSNETSQIMVKDELTVTNFSTEIKKIGYFQQVAKDVNILKLIPNSDTIITTDLNSALK